MSRIGIIGDGGWGTALAVHLAGLGHSVAVWGAFPEQIQETIARGENVRFLPGVKLDPGIQWTADPGAVCAGAEFVVTAVPSRYLRGVLDRFKGVVPQQAVVVNGAKGFDPETGCRLSRLISEELQCERLAVLSGPSHAEEVARGIPTAVVVAAEDVETARRVQAVFSGKHVRVYTSTDLTGVELGGALKNVIALAVGVSDGLGFGDNTRAALITRGLAEMIRLGKAMGARVETFAGLSGIGDLVVTATSRYSRNRAVGERIGKGESPQQVIAGMVQVAEGVWACKAARELAQRYRVEMPITEQVYRVIYEGASPAEAVRSLLGRPMKDEFY